ncbi:exosome complex component RRP43 isoform X2 [Melospiza melodia melodia]|uniref:exosome complex component RRP43 isoform X2 n=1 Tax=Melospiza melodia melodia TaxID=1914991 RepID=UPI002FD6A188
MAAAFKTVEPLEYYRRFLKENCRPDGRELGEFRTTTVNIGSITTADGSALVKLGNTTVICGVKAELAAPAVDAANKGYIVPNVELPSLCAERFRSGPPGEEAQAASQFIADVIENSQMMVKEDLCIANGKLAWVLYCDIICLDYDGNLLDASVFALLAALKNVQLPLVTINEETGLSEVNLKQKNPLIIRKHPVATSFAVFDDVRNTLLEEYRTQQNSSIPKSNCRSLGCQSTGIPFSLYYRGPEYFIKVSLLVMLPVKLSTLLQLEVHVR